MPTSAARHATAATLDWTDVLSDDGTRLRAWTNDPDGTRTGPTVVLCNGLGTNAWCWPALLRPDNDVRVVSWNHRGTGGSARPADPQPGRHRGVRRGRPVGDGPLRHRPRPADGLVDGGSTPCSSWPCATPERVSGLFGVAGVPGDTFATMLGPLRLPHPVARLLAVNAARTMSLAGRLVTPISSRLPIDARVVSALTHSGFMMPVPRPRAGRGGDR